jgi:hypothetical protein
LRRHKEWIGVSLDQRLAGQGFGAATLATREGRGTIKVIQFYSLQDMPITVQKASHILLSLLAGSAIYFNSN